MNDQQDALCRLAKLRELHSHYRQCEANEAIVRANLVDLVQKKREAKHALDDYLEAESKPLPLFDNLPRPEDPPATLIDTIERKPEPVLDLEAVLEADAELDAEENDPTKNPVTENILVEVCPGVSFTLYLFPDGTAVGQAPFKFGNWDDPHASVYWPTDKIVSGMASLATKRELHFYEHGFLEEKGVIELQFRRVPRICEGIPEPKGDHTALWERYWLDRRHKLRPEFLADRNLRLALCDWRKRQAEGDVEPRWDRWSEFRVEVGGQSYECLIRSDLTTGSVLNVWGPGVGPEDYHSGSVTAFGIAPVEYAEELIAGLLKPKRKKKGGRS